MPRQPAWPEGLVEPCACVCVSACLSSMKGAAPASRGCGGCCCHQWLGVTIFWLCQVTLFAGSALSVATLNLPFKVDDIGTLVLLGLLGYSYFMVFLCAVLARCVGAGSIPDEWPWDSTKPRLPHQHEVTRYMSKIDGRPRFCRNTGVFKPDRAHFCRVCGKYVRSGCE